jgi:nucleotide-binding universal stress UspA family protein
MSILIDAGDIPVEFVLHPTDLSEASQTAFHHALAMGIRYGAQFTLLHAVGRRATDSWPGFPSVRETLARWRAAGTTAGFEKGIKRSTVSKVEVQVGDPVAASLEYIGKHSVDFIVLATEGGAGLSRLIRAPRAERLARQSRLPTLFVPAGGRSFVSGRTGEVKLRRILVPVGPVTDPQPAMLLAVRSAALLDDPLLEITLLQVGEGEESHVADVPQLPFCRWDVMRRSGPADRVILQVAEEIRADAIYMATKWRKPALRRLDGGVTERVLQGASCPVAAIPSGPR